VLPLLPGYLSMMSGYSAADLAADRGSTARLLRVTLLFVLGFSVVFVLLGAAATTVGRALLRHQQAFATAAGWLVVAEDEKAFEEAMERALLLPEAEFQAMQVAARAAVAHNGLDEGVRRFTEASRDVLEHWRARMPGSAAWESSL
jgi:cytochrome c biogenesis protein CcdA